MNTSKVNEFYVYVDSYTNSDLFTRNLSNAFTNVISPPLKLNGDFDVAMQNIIFKNDICIIKKDDANFSIDFHIITFNNSGEMGDNIYLPYKPTMNLTGENIHELISSINNDLKHFFQEKMIMPSSEENFISLEKNKNIINFKKIKLNVLRDSHPINAISWNMTRQMGDTLGIDSLIFTDIPQKLKPPKFPPQLEFINIYSDIVEPSYFGGKLVHLLDIIPTKNVYSKTGTLTMYKKVCKPVIDEISIRLTDQFGENIKFESNVKVLIILHFKRIE